MKWPQLSCFYSFASHIFRYCYCLLLIDLKTRESTGVNACTSFWYDWSFSCIDAKATMLCYRSIFLFRPLCIDAQATMLCYRSIFLFRLLLLLLPQKAIHLTHEPCKPCPVPITYPNSFKLHRHVIHDPLLIPWLFIFQNQSCMTIQAPFCPFQVHFHTILYSFISSLSNMLQTSNKLL